MLVDAFLYAGERDMLDLRVHTLAPVVDLFVGVICARTHQNEPWDYVPAIDQLMEAGCRFFIVHPSMELTRKNGDVWTRPDGVRGEALTPWFQHIEKQHRYGVVAACDATGVPANAVVMVSDVDEIPDPKVLGLYNGADAWTMLDGMPGHTFTCAQRFHSGALDVLHPQQPWLGTTISRRSRLDPQGQRDERTTAYDNDPQIAIMHKAGWHFSWFGTDQDRARKLRTFSHAELVGRFDPAEGRATLTHSNGEQLVRLHDLDAYDWPAPIVDKSFVPPPHWWYIP